MPTNVMKIDCPARSKKWKFYLQKETALCIEKNFKNGGTNPDRICHRRELHCEDISSTVFKSLLEATTSSSGS